MSLTAYVVPIVTVAAALMAALVIAVLALNYHRHHSVGTNAWMLLIVAVLLFGFSFWQSFDISASKSGVSMKVQAKLADMAQTDAAIAKLLGTFNCPQKPDDQRQQETLRNLVTQRQKLTGELTALLEPRDNRPGELVLVRHVRDGKCVNELIPADHVASVEPC